MGLTTDRGPYRIRFVTGRSKHPLHWITRINMRTDPHDREHPYMLPDGSSLEASARLFEERPSPELLSALTLQGQTAQVVDQRGTVVLECNRAGPGDWVEN